MTKQLSLDYGNRATRAKRKPQLARRMIAILSIRKRWTTRMTFCMEFGFSEDGRECRLGCEASNCRIIYSKIGYKLMRDSTPDEIREWLNAIRKQRMALERKECKSTKRAHAALAKRGEVL